MRGTFVPRRIWDETLKDSTELEAEVVRLCFSLSNESPLSVTQAAKTLKLGYEHVRKIEVKVPSKVEKVLPQGNT